MAESYVIFEVYMAKNWEDIKAGKEVICEVQSQEDALTYLVKAKIAKSFEELPDGKVLQVRNEDGEWKRENWVIKIIEGLDPDEVEFSPPPVTSKPQVYGSG